MTTEGHSGILVSDNLELKVRMINPVAESWSEKGSHQLPILRSVDKTAIKIMISLLLVFPSHKCKSYIYFMVFKKQGHNAIFVNDRLKKTQSKLHLGNMEQGKETYHMMLLVIFNVNDEWQYI